MKKISLVTMMVFAAGCGGQVRYLTARDWIEPPAAQAPATTPPATAPAVEGQPATPPPAAVPAPASGIKSNYFVTYWEGKCGGFGGGCSKGTSKVKRCHVNADNSAQCVDEQDINRLLAE